jgi:hypothetical protein
MNSVVKPPTGSFPSLLRLLDGYHSTQEPTTASLECLNMLKKLARNILDAPDVPRYQRFKTRNKAINKTVMSYRGSDLILPELGFKPEVHEMEEVYVFRGTQEGLKLAYEQLEKHASVVSNALARNQSAPAVFLAKQEAEKQRAIELIEQDAARRKAKGERGKVLGPADADAPEATARQLALLAVERRRSKTVDESHHDSHAFEGSKQD